MQRFVDFNLIQKNLLLLLIHLLVVASAKDESTTSLQVEYLEKYPILNVPLITPLQEEFILERGSNFTLRCDSLKEVEWVKWDYHKKKRMNVNSNQLLNADNVFRPNGSLLHLEDVSAKDVGLYTCMHKERATDINYFASDIYIYVKDPDQLIIADVQYYFREEKYSFLPCKPTEPSIEMLLTHGNLTIYSTKVIPNSTANLPDEWKMIIKNITFNPREGFKLYSNHLIVDTMKCTGFNSTKNETKKFNLYPHYYDEGTIFSETGRYAIAGKPFNLTCEFSTPCSRGRKKFEWKLPDHINMEHIISTEIYTFHTVDLSDGTSDGGIISKLLQTYDSEFIFASMNELNGNTDNMLPRDMHHCIIRGTSILTIKNAQSYNSGEFMCSTDGFTSANTYYFMKIMRLTSPITYYDMEIMAPSDSFLDVSVTGSHNVDSLVNRSINLVASVDGFPPPTIEWYNGKGEKIEASEKYHFDQHDVKRTLEIRSAQLLDAGTYTLKASNGNDSRIFSYEVRVFDVPKVEMSDAYIEVNGEARLTCRVASTTPVRVTFILTKCLTFPHWPTCFNTSDPIVVEEFNATSNSKNVFAHDYFPTVPTKVRCEVHNFVTPYEKPEIASSYIFISDFEPHSNMTLFRSDGPQELIKGDVLRFVCSAMVYHLATANLQWFLNDTLLENGPGVNITFSPNNYTVTTNLTLSASKVGTFTLDCRAPYIDDLNSTMQVRHTETIYEPEMPTITYLYINSSKEPPKAIGVGLCLLMALLAYTLHRNRVKVSEWEAAGLTNFVEGAVDLINPELQVSQQAELLPYDRNYEFPREKLQLGKQLGSGAFGVVFKATAQGITEGEVATVVAVKMVHQTADNETMRALVSELKILIHLGSHLNVVNLLGAVTKNIERRELMMIVEYCPFGNVKDYLVANREHFVNQIVPETGEIDASIGSQRDFSTHVYENVATNMRPPLTTGNLVSWAFQVARGMDYLASRKVMHGDLAARNILLCENNVVKICDFGLARSLYRRTTYKKLSDAPLPIRWLALETFTDNVFSTYTDVWAFGVVMWEMFSLGKVPYPDIGHGNLFPLLRDGYRLERPQFANDGIYEMMLQCWSEEPTERPLFDELEQRLAAILGNENATTFVAMNAPSNRINRDNLESRQLDYLSSMASPCGASRQKPHYVNEVIHCDGNTIREETDRKPGIPSRAAREPHERNREDGSSAAYHHYENMPMSRDIPLMSIDNPSYGILNLSDEDT